jgi:hypothetical protein
MAKQEYVVKCANPAKEEHLIYLGEDFVFPDNPKVAIPAIQCPECGYIAVYLQPHIERRVVESPNSES